MNQNLKTRTKQLALRVIPVVRELPSSVEGRNIANQLFRCGTSVAANYRACQRARSKAEFIAKLGIVHEECDETLFWLELIIEAQIMPEKKLKGLYRNIGHYRQRSKNR